MNIAKNRKKSVIELHHMIEDKKKFLHVNNINQ